MALKLPLSLLNDNAVKGKSPPLIEAAWSGQALLLSVH